MEKKFKLQPPSMPNFIIVLGLKESSISVADLTVEEAAEYGELMKQEFIKHHKHRAENKKTEPIIRDYSGSTQRIN